MIKRFEWVEAQSTEEAISQSSKTATQLMVPDKGKKLPTGTVIKAGGIDLLDLMKEGLINSQRVINIRSIEALSKISFEKNRGMIIGPLLTLSEIAENKEIQKRYTALSDAASHIATPNIRNAATLGGNLLQRPRCWYFRSQEFICKKKGGSDCQPIHGENKYHAIFDNSICPIVHPSTAAVALIALGASIELTSKSKSREISLEEFFIGPDKDVLRENILEPDELITAIRLPDEELKSAHIKMGEKDSFDWSTGDSACALTLKNDVVDKVRIVLGAAAPTPLRASAAEKFLTGKQVTRDNAREAGRLAVSDAKPLSQNGYKVQMLAVAVQRALMRAVSGS